MITVNSDITVILFVITVNSDITVILSVNNYLGQSSSIYRQYDIFFFHVSDEVASRGLLTCCIESSKTK